jgi:hypothetical protein
MNMLIQLWHFVTLQSGIPEVDAMAGALRYVGVVIMLWVALRIFLTLANLGRAYHLTDTRKSDDGELMFPNAWTEDEYQQVEQDRITGANTRRMSW